MTETIGFIGAGQMAEALISGILEQKFAPADAIHVSDPALARLHHMQEKYKVITHEKNAETVRSCQNLVLAVKPQQISQILEELSALVSHRHRIISIAAGIPIKRIQKGLGIEVPVFRVMPNLAAAVQTSASVVARGTDAHDVDADFVMQLFRQVGLALELPESQFDAVTALSGSGPAYVFIFLEALIEGGVIVGLDRQDATQLALQTLRGSAELLNKIDEPLEKLRERVTSPGGTTFAALEVLEHGGFRNLMHKAVSAAAKRAHELSTDPQVTKT